jgi:3-deoxy-manno-octulosonate cytidylyltransferase (CMP-KDO synthetase)
MNNGEIRITAVIPAHLASVRFPRKILIDIKGLPMVEHVRRRALLSFKNEDVYVATCDSQITESLSKFNANLIQTSNKHTNGTNRVAEAVKHIDCTHVILLQGDEPLLLPSHLDLVKEEINKNPDGDAWNVVGPLNEAKDLDKHSFVKSITSVNNKIIYCFRKSPITADFEVSQSFVKKIHGIIAYRKDFLLNLVEMPLSNVEKNESIEQMRIIENGFILNSVLVDSSTPSINEPHELDIVLSSLANNKLQSGILEKILSLN